MKKKKTNAPLVSLSSVSLPVRLCLRVFVWVLSSGFPCVTFHVPLAYLVFPYFPACQVSLSLSCSLGFPRPFPLLSSLALLGVSMFYSPVHVSLLCSTHSPQSVMCFMSACLVSQSVSHHVWRSLMKKPPSVYDKLKRFLPCDSLTVCCMMKPFVSASL